MKINRGKIALDEHDKLLEHSKGELDKIVEEAKMVRDGKVTMRVKMLKLPTPVYGEEQPTLVRGISGQGAKGQGTKILEVLGGSKGGDEHAEYEMRNMDFDEFIKYYQKLLLNDLDLPYMKKKRQGHDFHDEFELNDFSRDGMRCDLDLDMTIEQAYERAFREKKVVTADPRIDGWYWEEKPTQEIQYKSLEIYVMDVSGSVTSSVLGLVRKMIFCLYYYLDHKYTKNERKYIVFQDNADVKSRDEFFSTESKGGTHVSSGLKKALELAEGYNDYDKYLFFFSDFENASSDDELAKKTLYTIAESFTYMCMTNICSPKSADTTPFSTITKEVAEKHSHISYTVLHSETGIREAIINLLTKDDRVKKI